MLSKKKCAEVMKVLFESSSRRGWYSGKWEKAGVAVANQEHLPNDPERFQCHITLNNFEIRGLRGWSKNFWWIFPICLDRFSVLPNKGFRTWRRRKRRGMWWLHSGPRRNYIRSTFGFCRVITEIRYLLRQINLFSIFVWCRRIITMELTIAEHVV